MSTQGVGRYFCFIKNKVSSDWKDLAWCLGFETSDIENIDGKHRDDKSRCMDLLQQWYKQKGNNATIHVLMEALQDAELQHVVDSLKDKYPELDEKPMSPSSSSKQGAIRASEVPLQPTASGQAGNIDAMMKEMKMLKEKNEKAEKILLEQKAEMNKKIQHLQETNKNMEARMEELLTTKQPVESWQKESLQTISNTGQVRQSVVQPEGKDTGTCTKVRSIRVGQPWIKQVRFGGGGSGRGGFAGPHHGAAVSQDNEVYIADWLNSRIQVFTMDGVYIREFTTSLPGEIGQKFEPHDVAVDRNDNQWVVSYDHVVQYSREGTCLAKINLQHITCLRSITVAMATEQVIVTECDYDGQNSRLRVLNQDGSEVGTYGSGHRSPEPWWPQYVTVDGEGNILVTDNKNHCVHVLDREGNFKFKFGSEGSDESQLKGPQDICVDGMGNIIVADSENSCVKMFDSQGRFLCDIGSDMKKPWGVAISPGRDVVVTDFKDRTVSVWTQG
ncbi:tripartite motif-containing protein 3-like [Branchiostoma lanceolatum]|uniref:tripartite motif-containing protein 3-like n=1 Tax=Branchiostoma lanceolatum TaxID=7740 RepID=UPI00345715F2